MQPLIFQELVALLGDADARQELGGHDGGPAVDQVSEDGGLRIHIQESFSKTWGPSPMRFDV